jgi:AraC-like DNA-binding protein
MAPPRRDTRGIVDAPELFARVTFRRREPAARLRAYVEHYWLIDWDLAEPHVSQVVPHPCVNLVLERRGAGLPARGELAGPDRGLFTTELTGRGRVCGVQFRPGGFRPFLPRPVAVWTGRHVPLPEAFPGLPDVALVPQRVVGPDAEDARVAALDAFLLGLDPRPDPVADRVTALVQRIREDRTVRRVTTLAEEAGLSVRALQRLFTEYVGVSPKFCILRYRIHEALERATTEAEVDWALLAADLGYSDQAHLARDVRATVGVPPTAYAR